MRRSDGAPDSRPQAIHEPRKCDALADVRRSANPGDGALEAEAESRVREGAVLPKVEVPAVGIHWQPFRLDPLHELVVVVFTLASADDLAVPFRREAVVAKDRARILRVFLHVEGFRFLRIVEDEDRTVVILHQERLVLGAEILPPLYRAAFALEDFHRLGVGDPWEWGRDALEGRRVALELPQIIRAPVQRASDEKGDELLLKPHVVVRVVPGDLRLDHPEFGEVPARLRLLGAEGRPKGVDLPEGGRRGFAVELPGLRQIRRALIEVFGLEQPGSLADGGGQDRGINAKKPALIEEIMNRLLDLVAHPGDGALAAAAKPEVSVVEQEVDAVLLRLDGIVRRARTDDIETEGAHLQPAGRARVFSYLPSDGNRSLDGQLLEPLPHFRRHAVLDDHRLKHSRAVAQHDECDLAGGAEVRDPASNRGGATDVLAQRLDTNE